MSEAAKISQMLAFCWMLTVSSWKTEHCVLKAKPHPSCDVMLMERYDAAGCFAVSGSEWCAETERPINYQTILRNSTSEARPNES